MPKYPSANIDPRLLAKFDRNEIVAVYNAVRTVAGRRYAKRALQNMDCGEFADHFEYAAQDGYYRPAL